MTLLFICSIIHVSFLKAFSTFVITISLHYLLTDASIDKYDIACGQWLSIA